MYPRKYYDAAPEAGSGGAPVSIAAEMARSGRLVQSDEVGWNNPQQHTEPPKEQVISEAPKTETVPPKIDPASTEETPRPPTAEPKVPSWQEVLKQQQPDAIFKELGFDDKAVKFLGDSKTLDEKMWGFFNHWKSKGDVKPYLEALTVDYEKMTPEEVMRNQLRSDFPEMPNDQFERLYKVKVIDKYKLDPDKYSEDDIENGKIELFADAKPVRQSLMKTQKEFLLSTAGEPQPDPRIVEYETKQKQDAENFEAFKSQVLNDNYTKSLLTNKKIVVGEGDDKFNYELPDPNKSLDILFDKDKWAQALTKEVTLPDGTKDRDADIEKMILVSAFVADPSGFLREYAKHLKALGAGSVSDQIENAKQTTGAESKDNTANLSPAAAMAKYGRIVSPE